MACIAQAILHCTALSGGARRGFGMVMVHAVTAMLMLVVPLAIMMHPAMVFRHGRLHAWPCVRSHGRLLTSQFLGATLDFRRARRVRALTDRALRYLRKRGGRTKQQWEYGELDFMHFHDAPLLTSDAVLSDNSGNWFLKRVT